MGGGPGPRRGGLSLMFFRKYMKTEGMSFTMSKNFTIFNDLKIRLVCSVKDEKVIMQIARFCSMKEGLTFDS